MGAHHLDAPSAAAMAGRSVRLVADCLTDMAFLNCRPSVIAAALLYVERRSRGIIPFWPSMLAKLTGYQDMSTPELSVAIKAAQRMCGRGGGIPRPASLPRSLSRSPSAQALAAGSSAISSSGSSTSSTSMAVPPPQVPVSAPLATASSAGLASVDLAAAVAAAAAAAGISHGNGSALPPLAVPLVAPMPVLPRAGSAERALSALCQASGAVGVSRSPSLTPPPTVSAAMQHQLLHQHLAPTMPAALMNGGVGYAAVLP